LVFLLIAILIGQSYQNISEAKDAERFPALGLLYDVNGRNMHLWCAGSGSPTVILEAGGGSSSIQWWALQEQLAEFSRVCSYNRAGFGWSDTGPGDLPFEDAAHALNALLSAADVQGPFILVGHSKGGLHVRTYARLYPDDIAGMLLLDTREEESFISGPDIVASYAA